METTVRNAIDLALNTAQKGTVNFNLLHKLLYIFADKLSLLDVVVDFDEERPFADIKKVTHQIMENQPLQLQEFKTESDYSINKLGVKREDYKKELLNIRSEESVITKRIKSTEGELKDLSCIMKKMMENLTERQIADNSNITSEECGIFSQAYYVNQLKNHNKVSGGNLIEASKPIQDPFKGEMLTITQTDIELLIQKSSSKIETKFNHQIDDINDKLTEFKFNIAELTTMVRFEVLEEFNKKLKNISDKVEKSDIVSLKSCYDTMIQDLSKKITTLETMKEERETSIATEILRNVNCSVCGQSAIIRKKAQSSTLRSVMLKRRKPSTRINSAKLLENCIKRCTNNLLR